jgi:hypothetical protein
MADAITQELISLGILDEGAQGSRDYQALTSINAAEVTALAESIAKAREYPQAMGRVNCSYKNN